jgi:hypothetical protein
MRVRITVVAFVVSSLLWSSPAIAQQHVVDRAGLHQAVADQIAGDQQNRDIVLGLLNRSEARAVADRLGLSLTRANAAIATLSSAELATLAQSARAADAQLAGGADRIVISVTTLLLIIIIVLLVAN